jgi:Flp pilus assembly CpaF family ATPase
MTNDDHQQESGWHSFRKDADKGREPKLIPGQLGRRMLSMEALAERIEAQFIEEYRDSARLSEASTATKRIKLILETTDYVLSVESAQLPPEDKADLIAKVYSRLFGYGPLDALFLNENITTISLEGVDKASARYGHGELISLGPIFQDEQELTRVIGRLLADAGAELREDQPYVETGLVISERPVCVNLIMPPVAFGINVDIRVHPSAPPALENLIAHGFLTDTAAQMLQMFIKSPHGLVIVGDTESGKTTLLSALLRYLPYSEQAIAIERAGELRLPEGVDRLTVQWPVGEQLGISFGEQINAALEKKPSVLILDEVRADEPQSIAPLLQSPDAPRLIWSFRGPADSKRLRNALSMLARRSDASQGEAMVSAMYEWLPFVITVRRSQGNIRLYSIAEWQFTASDYPDYVTLFEFIDGELKPTDKPVQRALI